MSDEKYGHIYTRNDVVKILKFALVNNASDIVRAFHEDNNDALRFPDDEPLFLLRAQDRRALGAIVHYLKHQSPRAHIDHIESIERAADRFEHYRIAHPDNLKDPD